MSYIDDADKCLLPDLGLNTLFTSHQHQSHDPMVGRESPGLLILVSSSLETLLHYLYPFSIFRDKHMEPKCSDA